MKNSTREKEVPTWGKTFSSFPASWLSPQCHPDRKTSINPWFSFSVPGVEQEEDLGFGNCESKIESEFTHAMGFANILVKNGSKFEPTAQDPDGEHHQDWGMISFDKSRHSIVYRQFSNKARLTLQKTGENEMTTVFEVSFPGKEYTCFGTNRLTKKR